MAGIFSRTSESDAIELLKQDHRKVEGLFKQFEDAKDGATRIELAQQICIELAIHAHVEEREFYSALRRTFKADDQALVAEAEVEHWTLKQLIAEIDGSTADARLFEANVKVLKEYVAHHVKEEEREIMPKARAQSIDFETMGKRMQKLKERLTAQLMDAMDHKRSRGKPRVRLPVATAVGPKGGSRAANDATASKPVARRVARKPVRKAVRRATASKPRGKPTGRTARRS